MKPMKPQEVNYQSDVREFMDWPKFNDFLGNKAPVLSEAHPAHEYDKLKGFCAYCFLNSDKYEFADEGVYIKKEAV